MYKSAEFSPEHYNIAKTNFIEPKYPLSIMYFTSVSIVLSAALFALSYAAPASQAAICSIFSLETGQFLKFSADGAISADGQFMLPETNLFVQYLVGNRLRIESVKTEKQCFLVYEDGAFKGGSPVNGNDQFQMVRVAGNIVALRVINPHVTTTTTTDEGSASASGSGETSAVQDIDSEEAASEEPEECYLGFSREHSEPKCYSSTEFAATRFLIIH